MKSKAVERKLDKIISLLENGLIIPAYKELIELRDR